MNNRIPAVGSMHRLRGKYLLTICHYAIVVVLSVLFYSPAASAQIEELAATPEIRHSEPVSILVLASTSLNLPLAELARRYAKTSEVTVSLQFDTPAILGEQVEKGEEGDIIIAEDASLFSRLKSKGLIDVFRLTTLVRNRLVFAVPKGSHLEKQFPANAPLSALLDAVGERTLLVVADPDQVTMGKMVHDILERTGYWEQITPSLIRAGNSANARYLVEQGNAAGIVYASDVYQNPKMTQVTVFDSSLHRPIAYQAAVVASEHMAPARDFLEYLKSDESRKVFEKYGFVWK